GAAVQRVAAAKRACEHRAPARVHAGGGARHDGEVSSVPAVERERELPAHLVRPADGVAERSRDDARRLLERVADARGRERPARAHAQLQALNRAEVTRRELPGLRRPAPKRQKKWPALRRTPTSGEVAGALAPSAS